MKEARTLARRAVAAGLGLALALAPQATALAAAGAQGSADSPVTGEYSNPDYGDQTDLTKGVSQGDTKLYIVAEQDDLTAPEGSEVENIRVSIPVAIHYVARTERDASGNATGVLTGPSDDVVKFVNHTRTGAAHVSRIAVSNAGAAKIVKAASVDENDELSFALTPVQGQSDADGSTFTPVAKFDAAQTAAYQGNATDYVVTGAADELGYYTEAGAVTPATAINPQSRNDWNMAQKNGALGLNGLTGTIGGFDGVRPLTDYHAGTIHWVVRAGTRAQADLRDATVTVHFNSNSGFNKDCEPVGDQAVAVLVTDDLPARTALASGLDTAITDGSTLVDGPKQVTHADGTVTTYEFASWNTEPDGSGDTIEKIGDLGLATDIAGKTFELYAQFDSTTTTL